MPLTPKPSGSHPSQTIEQENKMKVYSQLWLAVSPCAIPPLPSWRRVPRQGKERKKIQAIVTQGNDGHPGGLARTWAEARGGRGPLRRSEPCAPLAGGSASGPPPAWLSPSAARTAAHGRRRRRPRQPGTWAEGSSREGALARARPPP